MRNGEKQAAWIFAAFGILPIVWIALLTAPYLAGGLPEIIRGYTAWGLAFMRPHAGITGGARNTALPHGEMHGLSTRNTARKILELTRL